MPQNVDVTLQQRVRRLMGLAGGPAIGVIEAVQPVSIISGFLDQRQPQLEKGDTLVRGFRGVSVTAGTALLFSTARMRTTNDQVVIWLQRIYVQCVGIFGMGRSSSTSIPSFGSASYRDFRLPPTNLGSTEVELGTEDAAGAPAAFSGGIFINGDTGAETKIIALDEILVSGPNSASGVLESFSVYVAIAGATVLRVGWEGVVFRFVP